MYTWQKQTYIPVEKVDFLPNIFATIHNICPMKGTIKRLVTEKNFGFITPEDGSKDVFFHASGLQGVMFADLHMGDIVEFQVEDSEKGPRAVNVTVVTVAA